MDLERALRELGDRGTDAWVAWTALGEAVVKATGAARRSVITRALAAALVRPLAEIHIGYVDAWLRELTEAEEAELRPRLVQAWHLPPCADLAALRAALAREGLVLRVKDANAAAAGFLPPCTADALQETQLALGVRFPDWYRFVVTRLFDGRRANPGADLVTERPFFWPHRELHVFGSGAGAWPWTEAPARARDLVGRGEAELAIGGFLEETQNTTPELYIVSTHDDGSLVVVQGDDLMGAAPSIHTRRVERDPLQFFDAQHII